MPPSYTDLGKQVKDLFSKGYTHGFLKFDSTTRPANGDPVEFKAGAEHSLSTQKLLGKVEVKYSLPKYGMIFTEKWNTDNVLGSALEIVDQFAKGVKVTLDTSYVPHTAKRTGVLKAEFAGEALKLNGEVTLHGGPVLTVAGVILQQNWLLGAQSKFDLSSNEVKGTSIALGRQTANYTIHSFTHDGREFGASLYHRVSPNVELGTQLGWNVGDNSPRFGLASNYRVNDAIFRAKVDNHARVAVSATHTINPGVKLTLSTQFGLISAPDASNKFGLGLEYCPHHCC